MLSIDTSILLYAQNAGCREHARAAGRERPRDGSGMDTRGW